jgi:hypothetical protein
MESAGAPDLHWVLPCRAFLELKSELELLGSERNADLTNDQVDAFWPLLSVASDSLALLVPSSFAL